ncbi:hypothetical protein [Streptomyces scabiei]|uniref:hypothetical protein n=1 Tax=Streptomyces scabiei TaxID=1930 RepID=UPI000A7C4D26|nr:hypothetical protein [Streptomyces scabiei]
MKSLGDDDTPPVDEETRERSAEQRNVIAPTPRDVLNQAEDDDEPDLPSGDSS